MSRLLGIARSALLPALLLAPGAAAAAAKDAAPTLPNAGEIKLYQSTNRVMVMMQIGDDELVPMVFDTGSDGNTVDALVTRRHRLKRTGTVQEVDGTTGKTRMLPEVVIPDITIGGLKAGGIKAVSVDYDRQDAMGIISSEIFTDSLLYLDLANNHAVLAPRATTPVPPGPATAYVQDIPSVQMVMPDGSTLPAHFDTGFNGELSLPVALMDKVPLMAPAKEVGRFKSINTEGPVFGGRIRGTIKIGPVTLDNPEVTFLGDLANIGLPVIRRVTLVIDPVANRNWILEPGARPGAAK
ncbi:MAG: aspartyl protease family protein [Sphingomonas sp.]|uniref:aspartyl protease family protein n=1 Tax=Sphingomonas sp. TaxID=28214 RepID=UPI001AC63242|nr:aspartyl protease family protein [Sphingomonas sp.]MBN8808595.1 aspartyl protease family protein [Sphingomonas sp.]